MNFQENFEKIINNTYKPVGSVPQVQLNMQEHAKIMSIIKSNNKERLEALVESIGHKFVNESQFLDYLFYVKAVMK